MTTNKLYCIWARHAGVAEAKAARRQIWADGSITYATYCLNHSRGSLNLDNYKNGIGYENLVRLESVGITDLVRIEGRTVMKEEAERAMTYLHVWVYIQGDRWARYMPGQGMQVTIRKN